MSKPLIPAQRREKIQEYLAIHQIARTADLCALLDTSEATVRRDLEWLEQKGFLERTHGGAILGHRMILEQEYQQRAQHHPEEKKAIGELAASLIEEGDIVFINSGTTATQVLQHIRKNSNITVITNNVSAVMELGEPGFHYFLTGGEFQARSNSLAGRFAIDNLGLVYANKTILGVDGISLKHGCTVPTNAEAEVVRKMIERTKGSIIIAADYSKWGGVSNFQVATIDEIDKLITDSRIGESARDSLAQHAVECLIASPVPSLN
ncbi:MAG TPA: DeoR/GlpR family DNA-binding transcription regulator [Anaerolineales bacterium]|nr:DeoR/GlpR family DNA-binding transcription regulator [Anaerolineales bacterium]HRK89263.1 DeoR/GlpR family DNA-binding transcription regulator [Anaerolineales bacterium]